MATKKKLPRHEAAAEAELAALEASGVPVPGPTAELLRTLSHTLDGLDLLDTGPQTAYARVKTAAQVQSVMRDLRELALAAGAEREEDPLRRLGLAG